MRKDKTSPKKTPNAKRFKREKRSTVQVDIEERLAACSRGDLDNIIHVGNVVEKALQGEIGSILRALLRGRSSMELSESRLQGGTLNADRFLGRLDAYEKIWTDLEQYVHDKDAAIRKLVKQSQPEEEGSLAEDPSPDRVGQDY